jgi:hypothetical protein
MEKASDKRSAPVPGQRPPLDGQETVAIPRPANELDGQSMQETPVHDPEKAG